MKYACIDRNRDQYSIQLMCRVLGVSRSGYYASKVRPESARSKRDREILPEIKRVHTQSKGVYGSPRIKAELDDEGLKVGRHKIAKLMRIERIRGIPKRNYRVTTQRDNRHRIERDQLKQDFSAEKPNERWVADMTSVSTKQGWLYLAVIVDLYSRKVVGWSMSRRMNRRCVIAALRMAVAAREPAAGLIHHSDRGAQYTSDDFRDELEKHKIECSMGGIGSCYDNAVAESFFSLLKRERTNRTRYKTREEARADIFDYIEVFYNRKRRHGYNDNVSPTDFDELSGGSL